MSALGSWQAVAMDVARIQTGLRELEEAGEEMLVDETEEAAAAIEKAAERVKREAMEIRRRRELRLPVAGDWATTTLEEG